MVATQLWIKCSCGVSEIWDGTREEAEEKIAYEREAMSKMNPPTDVSKHVMKVVETVKGALRA